MIPYKKLGPDCWDQNMITDILEGKVWQPVAGMFSGGEVVIVAGAYITPAEVNKYIKKLAWVVVIITSDEENLFDYTELKHDNMKLWIQTPRVGVDYPEDTRFIGVGYGETKKYPSIHKLAEPRLLDVFVSAQNTHERRRNMFKAFRFIKEEVLRMVEETDGFTKGMPPDEYHAMLDSAKIAPAPSGVVSPDSFRFYEALEHGCIPIADDISPTYDSEGYWLKLFPDSNFPILKTWDSLAGYIDDLLEDWTPKANRIFAWWQKTKRQISYDLIEDLRALGAEEKHGWVAREHLTVIIPSSVIPSHPDTRIIDEAIASVRHHLPDVEIIITLDGIRSEQEHRREDYEEYIRELLWKANNVWHNVLPVIFDEHHHQARMLREILPKVKTPNILYVEQDAPLVTDYEIDWSGIINVVESGEANLIRFMHEATILPDHQHLAVGSPELISGVPLQRTAQWSQRPHVASVAYYNSILDAHFHPSSKTMIEDVMHGRVQQYGTDLSGWAVNRLWVYYPQPNAKRSYHTDGREGDHKFDMEITEVSHE